MNKATMQNNFGLWSSVGLIVTVGLALDSSTFASNASDAAPASESFHQGSSTTSGSNSLHGRLLDRCCQVGREKAIESGKFNCKLSAREALVANSAKSADQWSVSSAHHSSSSHKNTANLLALTAESLLSRDHTFGDQCEMVLESCCMAFHRTKNCDSGKQFAKSGTSCMDVELSKEATIATESFNDCCMACSLGVLAARSTMANETHRQSNTEKCRLISHLASSLSGQMYEQTYTECCQESLPRPSGALLEPGTPIDCSQANACSQKCLAAGSLDPTTRRPIDQDRCDCFTGFRLAQDGVTCLDVDECKLNLHTCNGQSEICDNIRGSFRCLARSMVQQESPTTSSSQFQKHQSNFHHSNSHHSSQHRRSSHQQLLARSSMLDRVPANENSKHDQIDAISEPLERPFASLRLRPPTNARW